MTALDILQDTLDILKDNWSPGSTDSKTPKFVKITDFKRYEYDENQDIVIAQRAVTEISPVGVGDVNKHEFENFNIDIRVLGGNEENHFLTVVREVKKIVRKNKVNPLPNKYTETHVFEFNGAVQDLSDKTHHLWRKLIPVQFLRYKVMR